MNKHVVLVLSDLTVILGLVGFIYNPVFGLFIDNLFLNLLYVIIGLLGLIFAVNSSKDFPKPAQIFTRCAGIFYTIIAIVGWVIPQKSLVLAASTANNWLHLVFALLFLLAGFVLKNKPVDLDSSAIAESK